MPSLPSPMGETLTEGVREISWSGAELPDDWYDEFSVTALATHSS
jgi:uncharacterized protein YcnI